MVWPLNIKEMKREMGTRTRTRKGGKGGRGRKEERRRKEEGKESREIKKEEKKNVLHTYIFSPHKSGLLSSLSDNGRLRRPSMLFFSRKMGTGTPSGHRSKKHNRRNFFFSQNKRAERGRIMLAPYHMSCCWTLSWHQRCLRCQELRPKPLMRC